MNRPETKTFAGILVRFFWSTLTRFAKTVGCIFLIAGFVAACWFYQQQAPMIEAARYRESSLLTERLKTLDMLYGNSQRLVMQFKGASEFPPEASTAAFKPHFLDHYTTSNDLGDLRGQLDKVSSAKAAMKLFVMNRFETLVGDIQQKLLAHASSLKPAPTPPPTAIPQAKPAPTPEVYGLYTNRLTNAELDSRKSSLNNAKEFLGVLRFSAENPDNKEKLWDSISEIESLSSLFPSYIEPPKSVASATPAPFTFEPKEQLNAEKVAYKIAQIRNSVKEAILSSWALDEAHDKALETAEQEQNRCVNADARVMQISCKGRLKSAAGGAEWRGGRKVRHLQINMEDVHRYGAMGRNTPPNTDRRNQQEAGSEGDGTALEDAEEGFGEQRAAGLSAGASPCEEEARAVCVADRTDAEGRQGDAEEAAAYGEADI